MFIMLKKLLSQDTCFGRFFRGDLCLILLVLLMMTSIFVLINPNFCSSYNLISLSQSVTPFVFLCLGVMFVIATGGTDLSCGAVCIGAAVFAGTLCKWGMPFAFSIPIMILFGSVIGLLNGWLVSKWKLPSFIATLGTMMFVRGFTALLANTPNVFYPSNCWYNKLFSTVAGHGVGREWFLLFAIIVYLCFNKHKLGRYLLAIGSNAEAARLSGINVAGYTMLAYVISGCFAGIAAIFWSASFATISVATGNGMELDAIAGVYIGGSSAMGGNVNVPGGVLGSILLVVIRSGLNFALAKYNIKLNSTYVTFVLTGPIIVIAVLLDMLKYRRSTRDMGTGDSLRFRYILTALVSLLCICSIFRVIHAQTDKFTVVAEKRLALLLKTEGNGFWNAITSGARKAGKELDYTIDLRGTDSEDPSSMPKQREILRTLLSRSPRVIAVATIADGFADIIQQAYDMNIPVIEFDGGLWERDRQTVAKSNKNPLKTFVNSSVYESAFLSGTKFYEHIHQAVAVSKEPYVIGIIQYEANKTAEKRAKGFKDGLEKMLAANEKTSGKYRFVIEVKPSPINNAYKEALEALFEKKARAIFMSSEMVVNQVYDAIAASGGKYDNILFCGFDAGSRQVAWLKSNKPPKLIGSCSQNPFLLGHTTVMTMHRIAQGETVPAEVDVTGYWYTRDTVDEAIAQGIVYLDE